MPDNDIKKEVVAIIIVNDVVVDINKVYASIYRLIDPFMHMYICIYID